MLYIGVQYQFDVSIVLDFCIKNDRLLFLIVYIQCCELVEIVFNNLYNVVDNFIMLILIISGLCCVLMKNFVLWLNVIDFFGFGFKEGKNGCFLKFLKDYVFESEI